MTTLQMGNGGLPANITCYPSLCSFHLDGCSSLRLWEAAHPAGSDTADIHGPPM